MALQHGTFIDIYLGANGAWLSGVPGTSDPVRAKPEDSQEIADLRMQCEKLWAEHPEREDFTLRSGGISYRVSIMPTILETVFVMRRLSETIAPLNTLGIPPVFLEKMMRPNLTGLFVISGTFGQGKTTTASSVVSERLVRYGGVAITIEEPPEMPLHGLHGEGMCYQTWVDRGGFAHACRQAARWAPSIIFLGEIRDAETAIEALRASINGRLVICTAHADNPAMAIERIFALAHAVNASADDVLNMLSTGLIAVVHQRLENQGPRRQLFLEPLFLIDDDAQGIRNTIRQRKFDQLKSIVTLQKNRMIVSGGKPV